MRAWWLVGILSFGCGGWRVVARPTSAIGYRPIALRDVAPMGLQDLNAEATGYLSPLQPHEYCDGVEMFILNSVKPLAVTALPTPTDAASGAAAMSTMMQLMSAASQNAQLAITVPRERYAEVRDFVAGDYVRVRGYLSNYTAQDCGHFGIGTNRFLWIDTIERVAPPPVPPATQ